MVIELLKYHPDNAAKALAQLGEFDIEITRPDNTAPIEILNTASVQLTMLKAQIVIPGSHSILRQE